MFLKTFWHKIRACFLPYRRKELSMSTDIMKEEHNIHFHFGDKLDIGGKTCQIFPYEYPAPPELVPQYENMRLSDTQKAQISALYQAIPSMVSAEAMKNAFYVVKWPEGLPHDLIPFKDGIGYMGIVRGEGGKFAGHARFLSMGTQALMLNVFTLMSIITCQFFLTEINRKLTMINQKIDKILEFLYGDKKAELLSEIHFVQYAHANFRSIMEHSEQRAATIQNLQSAQKTAIQDIEFYLADLNSTVHQKLSDRLADVQDAVGKALQVHQCLEFAMQLYMTANLLEVYYAQNYDPEYLKYVEEEIGNYIDNKYEKQLIADFNSLKTTLEHKRKSMRKADYEKLKGQIEQVTDVTARLMEGDGKELKDKLHGILHSVEQPTECCIAIDGTMYLKKPE